MFQHLEIDQQEENGIKFEAAVCQKFWKDSPGDVLLEIFIRLPDFRTARRFATVCRFWRSLICHDPQFVSRFISQHRVHLDRYPPSFPHTIMFRKADVAKTRPIICQIFSEEWVHFYGKSSPSYSDFLPNSAKPIVRAACNDLLLVSSGPNCITDDLYICNPNTKQFIKLPTIERLDRPSLRQRAAVGYALLCTATTSSKVRFKVVEVLHKGLDLLRFRFTVNVFCSESRKWKRKTYVAAARGLLPLDIVVVARDEVILYWMEKGCKSCAVFYLYLSERQMCGVISLPPNAYDHHQHRIGVVRVHGGLGEPELRIIRVRTGRRQRRVHLKVWRLDGKSKWDLVCETRFRRPEGVSPGEQFLVPFVHPTNGDLVYIVWGTKVFQYNLVKASYTFLDELLETVDDLISIPMFLPYVGSNLQGNAQH